MPAPTHHPKPTPLEVATLVGTRQIESSIRCLKSLVRRSDLPIGFRIHCDGSLTSADRELLAAELPVRRFVTRAEADALAVPALAGYPRLRRLRERRVLALKLVDVLLTETTRRLFYVDSDVLFLRPFSFAAEQLRGDLAVFFPDRQSAYSLRSTGLLTGDLPDLPARVNTGLFSVPVERVDFAVAERFLERWKGRSAPWIEQTCWALCAGVRRTSLFHPRQMAIPSGPARRDSGRVALHFVSSVRGRLPEFDEAFAPDSEAVPVELRSRPTRRLTAGALLLDEVRRRLSRLRRA